MQMKAKFSESYRGWGTSTVNGPILPASLLDVAAGRCTGIDSVSHFNPLNDAATSPFGTGTTFLNGVDVSGGSDRLLYYFGGSTENSVGVLKMPAKDLALLEDRRTERRFRTGSGVPTSSTSRPARHASPRTSATRAT